MRYLSYINYAAAAIIGFTAGWTGHWWMLIAYTIVVIIVGIVLFRRLLRLGQIRVRRSSTTIRHFNRAVRT